MKRLIYCMIAALILSGMVIANSASQRDYNEYDKTNGFGFQFNEQKETLVRSELKNVEVEKVNLYATNAQKLDSAFQYWYTKHGYNGTKDGVVYQVSGSELQEKRIPIPKFLYIHAKFINESDERVHCVTTHPYSIDTDIGTDGVKTASFYDFSKGREIFMPMNCKVDNKPMEQVFLHFYSDQNNQHPYVINYFILTDNEKNDFGYPVFDFLM